MFSQFVRTHKEELSQIALGVRLLSMDAVLQAKSGHTGLPLGCAELGAFLYFVVMNYDPSHSTWHDRDRFILSAGHGSMLQYSLLHLAGFSLSLEDLKQFRQNQSKTPGHPEYHHTPGVECTTGPLGQGIANAVGMALAERMLAARFCDVQENEPLIDHRTYVIAGDGCMMEGVASEACSLAGHLKLNRLVVFYDDNKITIDGRTDISFTEDVGKRFEAYGWNVFHADGNRFESLAEATDSAYAKTLLPQGETGPSLIICKTIPGQGAGKWQGHYKIHGNPMNATDVQEAKKQLLGQDCPPFELPTRCTEAAAKLLPFRTEKAKNWPSLLQKHQARWAETNPQRQALWQTLFEGKPWNGLDKNAWREASGHTATRTAGGKALAALAAANPALVGGSADLAGSNLTTLPGESFVTAQDFSGRNIHFGVREHAMAAICNGLTLHGGLRAFCATFAVFSDYLRPAVRLAALSRIPVIFILTHDSYAVGEDGPTHQPVEHTTSLRAIPDLLVLRPADSSETFAAWENAVLHNQGPSVLLLTRQEVLDLDTLLDLPRRREDIQDGMNRGAYLLKDWNTRSPAQQKLTLIASGSEVSLALQTATLLEAGTFKTATGNTVTLSVRVVSSPAPQRLVKNPPLLHTLVPDEFPIFAIEAGATQGWGEITGRKGAIYGMDSFGASGPTSILAERFGFVPPKCLSFVLNSLGLR